MSADDGRAGTLARSLDTARGWRAFICALGTILLLQILDHSEAAARDVRELIAAASNGADPRRNLPRLEVVQELPTPADTSAVLWSSDGTKLAAYCYLQGAGLLGLQVPSPYGNLVTIWNSDGTIFREIRRPRPFFSVLDTFAFVAGDKEIVAPPSLESNTTAFSVFDIDTGEIIREIDGSYPDRPRNVNAAKVLVASPDQSILAATFGLALAQPVALYSTRDWSKLSDLPEVPANAAERPDALAFSRDGKSLAVVRVDGKILIYNVNTRQITQRIDVYPDLGGPVGGIAFSPDGSMVVVGTASFPGIEYRSGEKKLIPIRDPVRVFRTGDASRVTAYSESQDRIRDVGWSPDGRLIAFITVNRKLHLWDPFQSPIRERTVGLNAGATSLAFSPNGERLAVANGRNVTIFKLTR